MENPSGEQILVNLSLEFCIKESYFNLRKKALKVLANNFEVLYVKLNDIPAKMNSTYCLEIVKDRNYIPENDCKTSFIEILCLSMYKL